MSFLFHKIIAVQTKSVIVQFRRIENGANIGRTLVQTLRGNDADGGMVSIDVDNPDDAVSVETAIRVHVRKSGWMGRASLDAEKNEAAKALLRGRW